MFIWTKEELVIVKGTLIGIPGIFVLGIHFFIKKKNKKRKEELSVFCDIVNNIVIVKIPRNIVILLLGHIAHPYFQ